MPKTLPPHPSLKHLKNEAKALLKAQHRGDMAVCAPLRNLPRLHQATDDQILAAEISLQEVQHALACEYGFKSWKALIDEVAASESYAANLQQAYEIFTSKGPNRDSTGSAWEQRLQQEREKLLRAGDEGFRIMQELARSENGRARNAAAICFGLSDDPRAPGELCSLLTDPAVMVRSRAVRFYAAQIHPGRLWGATFEMDQSAETIPAGIDAILPLVQDVHTKVQLDAIRALSAYVQLTDERIETALQQAMADSQHKVQHAAARALDVACPGCDAKQ
jgi:HEAT repeat protein